MTQERNELLEYINNSLEKSFEKTAVIKETHKSSICIYTHKESGKKIVKRTSANRNDEVFRCLKNRNIPNLANILEVCSAEDYVVTLEEYIDGECLENIIADGIIDVKTACTYAYQLCNALIELHERKVIHRDIKPSNIIIGNDGEAYLIDLSIARMQNSEADSDTESLGTVGYAAPEQFGIVQSNRSTDIYALGIVLNKMITGVHPSITIPPGKLGKIIEKTTSIQISKRYSDAYQLQKKLKHFI